jgi:hypothetical protein
MAWSANVDDCYDRLVAPAGRTIADCSSWAMIASAPSSIVGEELQ